ncbi:MAG: NAD(P)H-hydrate dehydratase [Ruminococcaceae bacterium]|nr:NAD(P)H-hydrate dehydratase [Oscillospiraceae bacterium]
MRVFTAQNVKRAEEIASKSGFSYFDMMENAGKSVADEICKRKEVIGKTVKVLCGGGGNGGDGYVVARLLRKKGAKVSVVAFAENLSGTAGQMKALFDGETIKYNKGVFENSDIIVDALFGIGLNKEISGDAADIVKEINITKAFKVAVDIPSGLFADKGETTLCIRADLTVTFIAYKLCQLIFPARKECGEIVLSKIGFDEKVYEDIEAVGRVITPPRFKKRESNTHKGTYGTASLIVGSYGMAGAAILSLKGCLLSGVGIARAVIEESIYPIITVAAPEAVCDVYKIGDSCEKVINNALKSDAVLIGCGLSKGDYQRELLIETAKSVKGKLIIDADGINLLSENIECIEHSVADIVLTPHPAEMARLCKTSVKEIESNRIYYCKKLAKELSCTVALKGAVTLISNKYGELYFNLTGNPSMAKGGSGDTLSGIIVSLAAQGMSSFDAAVCGVYVHGLAGDMAAELDGEISALPSDMARCLPSVFKKLGE